MTFRFFFLTDPQYKVFDLDTGLLFSCEVCSGVFLLNFIVLKILVEIHYVDFMAH